jgi:hypothetical protein
VQHIRGCKAEESDTGQKQPILATIVLNEIASMRLAVVFKAQEMLAVVQIWASKDGTSVVPNGYLELRPR